MKYAGLLLLIALIFNPLLGATTQAQTPNPANLPLLAEGTHFGITYPYSEISNEPEIAAKVSEAAAEGVNGFTFYAEWGVLEPEPGVYDLTSLETTLIWLNSQQIRPMLNLSVINIDWLTLPPDLLNADGTDLADGITFDHPDMQARLFALLDEVVPLLVANGGFLITLGNELDNWFNGSPTASPEDLTAYAALVAAARDHIHAIEPELAVGVTLTGGETLNQGPVFQALMPVTDTLPFNFYPLSELLTVQQPEGIVAALEAHLQVYGDKPIVIQELGCPSDTSMESSLDYQHECFEVMFETLEAYPQVRYVSVFTLFDWDEPTCDEIVSFFSDPDEEIPPVILARWRGFHCTLGLLNPDLTPKPAWDALLAVAE